MPRRTKAATRRTFTLPFLQLERLEYLSQVDETPLAELLRRVADLITTFDFRGKMPIGPQLVTTSAVKFIGYMSDPMYQALIDEAGDQEIPPNELLRRGIDLYLDVKKVPAYGNATSPIADAVEQEAATEEVSGVSI